MDALYPLTIYYDHSCPLCRYEMLRLKQHDSANLMLLIDCSAAGFTPPAGAPSKAAMMQLLHAQTASGEWLVGVPVFQHVYRAAGFAQFANWMTKPFVQRILIRIYPIIALHRYLIPGCVSNLFLDWLARRSLKKSQACKNKQCSL